MRGNWKKKKGWNGWKAKCEEHFAVVEMGKIREKSVRSLNSVQYWLRCWHENSITAFRSSRTGRLGGGLGILREFRRISGRRDGSWVISGSRSTSEGNLFINEAKAGDLSISFSKLVVKFFHGLLERHDVVASYIDEMIMLKKATKTQLFPLRTAFE